MFGRDKIAKAAQEIADHIQVVDHVKALQEAQKALADAMKKLSDRIAMIEAQLLATKAEAGLEALHQATTVVNSAQSGLNQRIETLAIKVAILERENPSVLVDIGSPGGKAGGLPIAIPSRDAESSSPKTRRRREGR